MEKHIGQSHRSLTNGEVMRIAAFLLFMMWMSFTSCLGQSSPTSDASIPEAEGGALNLLGELVVGGSEESVDVTPALQVSGQYPIIADRIHCYVNIFGSRPSFDTIQDPVVRNLIVPKNSSFAINLGARGFVLGSPTKRPALVGVVDFYLASKTVPGLQEDSTIAKKSISTNNYRFGIEVTISDQFAVYASYRFFTINGGSSHFKKYFQTERERFDLVELGAKFKLNSGDFEGVYVDFKAIPVKDFSNLGELFVDDLRTVYVFGFGFEKIIN